MKLRLILLLSFAAARLSASDHPAPQETADAGHPPATAAAHDAPAPSSDAPAHAAASHANESTPLPALSEEIVSLLRIGQTKLDQGDYTSAEIAYRQVLNENATRKQDAEALTGLGRTYRKKGDYTKAAAVYEKFLKEFPEDLSLPVIYLELGRSLRALGAYKQAIGRFYSVINSTLKLPETGADIYRQLARTAQFEIAETYFQSGDYTQANRYFSRLKLLDLAPRIAPRAHFKSAYSLTLNGEDKASAAALRSFLDQNPNDENVPEARYLLSDSLRRQGHINESLLVALDLLKAESSFTEKDPKRWAYWQRKTGNQLANEFYERGDFGSALLIYQTLAKLSAEPSWRLPVTYQIGLSLERLQRFDRARECYQTIVDNVKPGTTDGAARPELADLAEMAAWRLNQLAWLQDTDKQLSQFFFNGQAPSSTSVSAQAPSNALLMTPTEALRHHQNLCDELHQLALEENRFLKQNQRVPDAVLLEKKRALLTRLDESLSALKAGNATSPASSSAAPVRPDPARSEIIEKSRARLLQILHLDRENEQLLLRYSLGAHGGRPVQNSPASTAPSPAAPGHLQRLYDRHR